VIFLDKLAKFGICYWWIEGQGINTTRDYQTSEGSKEKSIKTEDDTHGTSKEIKFPSGVRQIEFSESYIELWG
jgi:hypothetical protein